MTSPGLSASQLAKHRIKRLRAWLTFASAVIAALLTFLAVAIAKPSVVGGGQGQTATVTVTVTNVSSAMEHTTETMLDPTTVLTTLFSTLITTAPATSTHVVTATTTPTVTKAVIRTVTKTVPSTTPVDTSNPGIYRQGDLDLNSQSVPADFDAIPADPHWGRLGNSVSNPEVVRFARNYISGSSGISWGGEIGAVMSGPVTWATCANYPNYIAIDIPIAQIVKGLNVCLQTDEGRWALLTVTAVNYDNETCSIHVVVWNKA